MFFVFVLFFLMNWLLVVPNMLTLLLLVVSQFQLQPVNVTVLKGSDAQINATLPTGWLSVTWTVDETQVLVFNPSGNSTATSKRYSASFCITDNTECVQFIIRNVTRNDKVVECNVLGIQGSQTARLDVQGKARNYFFLKKRNKQKTKTQKQNWASIVWSSDTLKLLFHFWPTVRMESLIYKGLTY